MICTNLLAPDYPPFSGLGYSVHIYRRPLLRASTSYPAVAVLPPPTCYPGPSWPLQPRVASLFLPPLPPSVIPPLSTLDISSAPDDPCRGSLLRYKFLCHVLESPPPPPARLDLRPGICWSRGGLCLQFLASCNPLL